MTERRSAACSLGAQIGPGSAGWISWLTFGVVALAFVVFAVRFFRLISRYAVNIFFGDQWKFNDATLFQKLSIWQMFDWQYGPHRLGLGALFEKVIEPAFRWNSRTESFVIGAVVVAAALCALFLKKRLYGQFSFSDVLIPAVFFIPGQFETLFVTANFAHGPLPVLLVLLYCLAWTCPPALLRYVLVLIINFVTIYTGFGLFVGVITPILLILDRRASTEEVRSSRLLFAVAVGVSILSLVSFFVGYRIDSRPGSDFAPVRAVMPQHYIAYVALMFANFFGLKPPHHILPLAAGLITLTGLLGSLFVCARQLASARGISLPDKSRARSLVIVALITYCLLFCLMTAVGRMSIGMQTAFAPRYLIYLELGVLGLYFQLLNISNHGIRRLLVIALLTSVVAATWHVKRVEVSRLPLIKQQWKTCYLRLGRVDQCNAAVGFFIYPPVGIYTAEHLSSPDFQKKLDYLKQHQLNLFAN